jgi:3-hydroxyisobutyrate dehydrogenase
VSDILPVASPGTVVSIHSTVDPATPRALADMAERHGVDVLDAPVSGGAAGAKDGRLAIMVGGSAEAFARGRPVLERLGDLVVHVGPVGAGTVAKLARNLLHFVAFAAATEALALAEATGVDLPTLGKIVRHTDAITGGPGAIMWRDRTGPLTADDPWFPIFDHVRSLGEKDLAFAAELGDQVGVDTPLADLALTRLGPGLGVA